MTIQTDRLTAKTTRSPNDSGCDRPGDARTSPLRPAQRGTSISIGLTILCLVLGSVLPNAAWGQPSPVPSPSRRGGKAQTNAATEQRPSTPPSAETAEYSSPDADHAVTSLRSRPTTTPTPATPDDDADLPWSTGLTRRLWENRILAPNPNEDAETRAALDDLISRIRAVRFDDDATPAFSAPTEPAAPAKPVPVVGPAQTLRSNADQPAPTTNIPTEPAATLTEAMLKKLGNLLHDPNQVGDPLEMAELLFLSGRQTEAAVFYEKALARTVPNDSSMENDRAWILFQLGNCLRQTDMARAKDMYMKLVSEYPASPWTELAKAHGRLITWYQTAKPQQFMPEPSPK